MGVRLKHLALLSLPALATAVSLSEFTPSATGLSSACQKIYTEEISGCTPQDFSSGHCSASCIKGVEALVNPIRKNCEGAQGENLIVAFLEGIGPQQICPNAPHFTPGPGPIGPPPMSQSGRWSSGSPATTITSGTETVSTAPASYSKSLLIDTSSRLKTNTFTRSSWTTSLTSALATHSAATTTTSSSASSSAAGPGNHGGSPLDIAGNTAGAASLSLSAAVLIFSAGVAVFTSFR